MTEHTNQPVLSQDDVHSATWKKIKTHCEQRLQLLRAKNDASLPIDKTEKLRGRIAEIKNLMALDQPAPLMEADGTD